MTDRGAIRSGACGLTLSELLVAMAILLIALSAALTLYDATWDSFKQGENAAEQQQGVRIAFEKISMARATRASRAEAALRKVTIATAASEHTKDSPSEL